MEFDFLSPPPLIQEKKKYKNFTVTEIGGPDEIVKWREMQAAKESIYHLRLGERDGRIRQFEKETRQVLDSPKVNTRTWEEKLVAAQSERKKLSKVERKVLECPPWEPIPEKKPSFFQRVKNFFVSFYRSANF